MGRQARRRRAKGPAPTLPPVSPRARRLGGTAALAGLLGLFVLLSLGAWRTKSPTFDEPVHLFAGYTYLTRGDFRVNPEHPPLAKLWAALPLLGLDAKDPIPSSPDWEQVPRHGSIGWRLADDMVFSANDADTLFAYARPAMVALGVLLGVFIYRWAKDLYGPPGGLAALFLYCLDPNILAHAAIVHTDVPFAAMFFIGTYYFQRAVARLTWPNLLGTASLFGLAAITKFSAITILPIWGLLGLLAVALRDRAEGPAGTPPPPTPLWHRMACLAAILLCALAAASLFVWTAYAFRFSVVAGGVGPAFLWERVMPQQPLARDLAAFLADHHLLPEGWLYGLLYVLRYSRRATFLLGELSDGFWLYFPVAFLVKTPVPTLALLAVTAGLLVARRRLPGRELSLLVPAAAYFAVAVWSQMNIGWRHILPVYPFLFVLIGGTAAELWRSRNALRRGAMTLLGLWALIVPLYSYPHYLAFFNELAGGSRSGYRILVDSNLDWGQDLKGLKRWMDAHGVKQIAFAYFGTANPRYYGIEAVFLPGTNSLVARHGTERPDGAPEYVAVSATHLQGVYLHKVPRDYYRPLTTRPPVAVIGHSIFVYRVN